MTVIPIPQDLPDQLYMLYTLHLPSDIDPIFLRDQPFLCETLTECDLHVTFFLLLEDGTPAARLQARTRSAIEHALERFTEAIEKPCVFQEKYLLKDIPSLRNQELLWKYSNRMDVADLVRPYPKELAIQRAEYAAILAERAAAAKASIPQPRAPRASSPQHSAIPRSPAKSQPKASGDQYFYEFLLPDDAYLRHDLLGEKSSRFRQMSEQAGLAHPAYVNDAGYLRVFGGEGSIRNLLQEYNDLMKVYTARDPSVDLQHTFDRSHLGRVKVDGQDSKHHTRDVALPDSAAAQLARRGVYRSERKWLTARHGLEYLTVIWDVPKPCLRLRGSTKALDAVMSEVVSLSERVVAGLAAERPVPEATPKAMDEDFDRPRPEGRQIVLPRLAALALSPEKSKSSNSSVRMSGYSAPAQTELKRKSYDELMSKKSDTSASISIQCKASTSALSPCVMATEPFADSSTTTSPSCEPESLREQLAGAPHDPKLSPLDSRTLKSSIVKALPTAFNTPLFLQEELTSPVIQTASKLNAMGVLPIINSSPSSNGPIQEVEHEGLPAVSKNLSHSPPANLIGTRTAEVIDLTASPQMMPAPASSAVPLRAESPFVSQASSETFEDNCEASSQEHNTRLDPQLSYSFEIPFGSRGFFLGSHGDRMRAMERASKATFDLHPDWSSHVVTITGETRMMIKDALQMTADTLAPVYPQWSLPVDLKESYQIHSTATKDHRVIEIPILAAFANRLTAEVILLMSEGSNCTFAVNHFSAQLIIAGSQLGIRQALKEVQAQFDRHFANFDLPFSILDEWFPNGLSCGSSPAIMHLCVVSIPLNAVDRIMAEENALQWDTRSRFVWRTNELSITGERNDIRKTLLSLRRLLKQTNDDFTSHNAMTATEEFCLEDGPMKGDCFKPEITRCSFQLPSSGFRLILGVSGSIRNHIQRLTCCSIRFDSRRYLIVEGKREEVKAALARISVLLTAEWSNWRLPSYITESLDLKVEGPSSSIDRSSPAKRMCTFPVSSYEVAILIGPQGQNKRQICAACNVQIAFDPGFCCVVGDCKSISRALEAIWTLMHDRFKDFHLPAQLKSEYDLDCLRSGVKRLGPFDERPDRKRRRSESPGGRNDPVDRRRDSRRERSPHRGRSKREKSSDREANRRERSTEQRRK